MRVLIVISLLVGAAIMLLFVLADLARDLSRHSFHASPDLDSSDDWDIAADEFNDTARPVAQPSGRAAGNCPSTCSVNHIAGSSNALDDLHLAL
jgi:hypothetical protein